MNGTIFTLRNLYRDGTICLEKAGIADAKLDAWYLLEYETKISRAMFLADPDKEVEKDKAEHYRKDIETRAQRIPLQHITGEQEFMGLDFKVNEHVLIPRQDTEILIEEVLKEAGGKKGLCILDMCTGSGCILLSLLTHLKEAEGTGADLSKEALKVAERNGKDLGISAQWINSDLFELVSGKYDILVSNPPYIQTEVIEGLMEEVKFHEPRMALDGREDGLYFYRRITRQAGNYLNPQGILAFEIGYDQGEAVAQLMKEQGYTEVKVIQDLAGLDRVVIGKKNQEENHV